MKMLTALGIMSGTSLDGVDYALCSVGDRRVRLLRHWQVKFPPRLERRLHDAARDASSSYELAQLHHDLGRFYARHAQDSTSGIRPELAGLHGQTIFHNPSRKGPATLQLGEPAYLAEALRVPVVSNFRVADLAAGGQGAPLATIFHQVVFAREGQHVCVNNLGGISNVTSIDWAKGAEPALTAFDTGPANMLIDMAMRYFTQDRNRIDRNGSWAARGTASAELVEQWLRHPYLAKSPPKSTGRELFGEPFWQRVLPQMRKARLSKFDIVATLTEFTGRSIALSYHRHLSSWPQTIILTGGGAANPTLVKVIRAASQSLAPSIRVMRSDALGWPLQTIEPAAFALLAYLRVQGQPGNLPETTGASRPVRLGQISEPWFRVAR